MKVKMDYNSAANQNIKGKFVEREVYCCFSYEMESILRAAMNNPSDKEYPLPSYDDIENLYQYTCPDCGEGYKEESEAKSCCKSEQEPESEPQEIYEWWIVSEYLYRKLREQNEPVLEWGNNHYWGRCCTGQAIILDDVISRICADMEILQGQVNDWSK